jgi:hypothetical protein
MYYCSSCQSINQIIIKAIGNKKISIAFMRIATHSMYIRRTTYEILRNDSKARSMKR